MTEGLAEKIRQLEAELAEAARAREARSPVRLVLVTKFVDIGRMQEAYEAGVRDFGENHAQEIRDKRMLLPGDVRWHMIGRLQTNKIKYLVGSTAMIQSLDRLDHALEIQRLAEQKKLSHVECLLQINSSEEIQKGGAGFTEAEPLLAEILRACPLIRMRGLMTVGPETADTARIRGCFRKTSELFRDFTARLRLPAFDVLSMGMTHDYRIAVDEGSTMVRVGSLVFGTRPPR